ncbi:MAG: hypothetical protein JO125_12350 [Chloroflexi bacterium]|nr:hypothetical protein [Chloroflexota bacterium]
MNTAWLTPVSNRTNPENGSPGAELVFEERKAGPFEWWYRLTAPAQPPATAPLRQREAARRGRLASTTLIFMSLITAMALPIAFVAHSIPLLTVLLVTLLVNALALALNRLGRLLWAGILFLTVLEASFALTMVPPGGLQISNLPVFDLLLESTLVAVAFFPAWSVFPVALLNCLLIWATLTFEPHTPELGVFLNTQIYNALVRPIILQIIVAVVTYLWVHSATRAIARADRAEEIATLAQARAEQGHILSEQAYLIVEQKRQLDMSIQQILQTHVQAAKGDFSARAPKTQDNVLWQIGVALNNLLARLQRATHMEFELQRMSVELRQVKAENEQLMTTLRRKERE